MTEHETDGDDHAMTPADWIRCAIGWLRTDVESTREHGLEKSATQ